MDNISWKDAVEDHYSAAEFIRIADAAFCGEGFEFPESIAQFRLSLLERALTLKEGDLWGKKRFQAWQNLNSAWAHLCFGEKDCAFERMEGESSSADDQKAWEELKRQIRVDVERSYNFLDAHLQMSQDRKARKRKQLEIVLQNFFKVKEVDESELKVEYLQGAHEICAVVLDVFGNDQIFDCQEDDLIEGEEVNEHSNGVEAEATGTAAEPTEAAKATRSTEPADAPIPTSVCVQANSNCPGRSNLRKLSDTEIEVLKFLSDLFMTRLICLHSSLALNIGLYMPCSLMLELLRECSPEVFRELCLEKHSAFDSRWLGDGSELHFCIPWLATMFAHSIKEFETVVKIWDILLSFPPPFMIYFCCALVEEQVEVGGLASVQDNGKKLEIPKENLVGRILPRAFELLKLYPYDCLFVGVKDDLSRQREANGGGVIDYFDAQESPHIEIPEMFVLPPLYARVLELDRTDIFGRRRFVEETARTRAPSSSMSERGRAAARRASARVIKAAGLDGWAGKVLRISREWQWLGRS